MTGWEGWSTGNCAKNWNLTIWTNGICTTQNLFWRMRRTNFSGIKMDHHVSARWPDLMIVNKKKRSFWIVNFIILTDHRVKLKESKKRDKYLDLIRELKKLWNMKMTMIPIITGALSTVTKRLVQGLEDLEIRGWIETIQTTTLSRSARMLRRVLETWGDFLSLKLQWETIS